MNTHDKVINAREAAFIALLNFFQDGTFLAESLEKWQKGHSPSPADYHLAHEIAYGTTRMVLSLDFLGRELSKNKKLALKRKEKVLLRSALYQFFYLEKIPLYALANETLLIAKKYCHAQFVGFLNAVLRRLQTARPVLPSGSNAEELSIRYSYPLYFVRTLLEDCGYDAALEILTAGNKAPTVEFRLRKAAAKLPIGCRFLSENPVPFAVVQDSLCLPTIAASPDFYIQNRTPAYLLAGLTQGLAFQPQKILDLCASPGGKLIAIHDIFPQAHLTANDVTHPKVDILRANLKKYAIEAVLTQSRGEELLVPEPSDVVIVDAPCSNTGVLHKRPEARWRLTETVMDSLTQLQTALFENALRCVKPGGEVWYMTCSILKKENEEFAKKMALKHGLRIRRQKLILPDNSGLDGGYACAFFYSK